MWDARDRSRRGSERAGYRLRALLPASGEKTMVRFRCRLRNRAVGFVGSSARESLGSHVAGAVARLWIRGMSPLPERAFGYAMR